MDRLLPNQRLNGGEELASNNGWFRLLMHPDGNLVVYRAQTRHTLWLPFSNGQPGAFLVMQTDGNLVAYSAQGIPLWATGTNPSPGAYVVMQDDGNLVVYNSANNPIWASNSAMDLTMPTIRYVGAGGYWFNETSESWKEMCRAFPCFAALQWPGYASTVIEDRINGQDVVIQLWKGWCPKFLGLAGVQIFPGGIGGEVGVYRRMPGRARPTSLPGLPPALAAKVLVEIANLTDDELVGTGIHRRLARLVGTSWRPSRSWRRGHDSVA
jgi:hypothetical protein